MITYLTTIIFLDATPNSNSFAIAFAAPTQRVHACQEMFALGTCNLVGSFVGSMPVVASLGRSAVNAASGARTTFGGCVTGLIILAAWKVKLAHQPRVSFRL